MAAQDLEVRQWRTGCPIAKEPTGVVGRRESGRGLPHSTTLSRGSKPSWCRQVLECASPLALSLGEWYSFSGGGHGRKCQPALAARRDGPFCLDQDSPLPCSTSATCSASITTYLGIKFAI